MNEHVSSTAIEDRKRDHIAICLDQPVEATGEAGLLDEVHFLHEALPELDQASIDLSQNFLGRRLRLPVMISSMTGGHPQAAAINRALAEAAGRHGLAMGVGSQRAMLEDPERSQGFQLRRFAPGIALVGNLGAVQVRDAGPSAVRDLVQAIEADGLCIHLNPAQEIVQSEGDRDFRGCLDAIAATVETLSLPVIVKETGCGLSPRAAERLAATGVAFLDVAGSGGTSWTRVESHRGPASQRQLGARLGDWGIPTAASLLFARDRGPRTIASGGLRNGLDLARGIALGAHLGGMALPFLRAYERAGAEALDAFVCEIERDLRAICLLTASKNLAALRRTTLHLGPELRSWQALDPRQREPARRRSEPLETLPSIARGDVLLTRDGHHPTTQTP